MARVQSIEIREILNRMVPKSRLEKFARETGAWSRNRKITATSFFWSLILGFSAGNHRTIAGIRRSFEKSIGRKVVPSAFYDRFTPNLVTFLKTVLGDLMRQLELNYSTLAPALRFFKDILITDSTLIRLHDMLETSFPSVWTHYMRASLKAHVILSVRGGGMNSVKITAGSQHDGRRFRAGRWMKGKLMIFDLGYHHLELFQTIGNFGGYFLGRLKETSNPRVIDDKTPPRSRPGEPVGIKLKTYLETWDKTKPVDLEVEFYSYFPPNKHRRGTFKFIRSRVVGCYNAESQKYHLYVTNIPKDVLTATQVVSLYSARWLIELLFRELKTNYRLGEIPSRKRHVVEALVYAALITLLVSRKFLSEIRKLSKVKKSRFPEERWAAIWATISTDLLAHLLRNHRDRTAERYLLAMIRHEAIDPNKKRRLLSERAFGGSCAA